MQAFIWLHGRTCRVLIKDNGNVIDMNDDWNNHASAESWVYDTYPTATIKSVRDLDRIKSLNDEWSMCKFG
jgi:hypothetical protein